MRSRGPLSDDRRGYALFVAQLSGRFRFVLLGVSLGSIGLFLLTVIGVIMWINGAWPGSIAAVAALLAMVFAVCSRVMLDVSRSVAMSRSLIDNGLVYVGISVMISGVILLLSGGPVELEGVVVLIGAVLTVIGGLRALKTLQRHRSGAPYQ